MIIFSSSSIIHEPSFVRVSQQFVISLVNRLMYPDCPHRLYFVQLCNTTAVPVIHVGLKVDRKRSSSAEGISNGTLIGQYCNRNALIKLVYTMWLLHVWWRHLSCDEIILNQLPSSPTLVYGTTGSKSAIYGFRASFSNPTLLSKAVLERHSSIKISAEASLILQKQ